MSNLFDNATVKTRRLAAAREKVELAEMQLRYSAGAYMAAEDGNLWSAEQQLQEDARTYANAYYRRSRLDV